MCQEAFRHGDPEAPFQHHSGQLFNRPWASVLPETLRHRPNGPDEGVSSATVIHPADSPVDQNPSNVQLGSTVASECPEEMAPEDFWQLLTFLEDDPQDPVG